MGTPTARSSRTIIAASIAALAFACFVAPVTSAADEGGSASPPINMNIKDAPIAEVMTMLSEASGVNIVVGQDVSGTIESVNLKNVSVEDALRWIAMSAGLHWYKETNGYIVTAKEVPGAVGAVVASASGAAGGAAPAAAELPGVPAIPGRLGRPVSSSANLARVAPAVPTAAAGTARDYARPSASSAAAPAAPLGAAKYSARTLPSTPAVPGTVARTASPGVSTTTVSALRPTVPAVARGMRTTTPTGASAVRSAAPALKATSPLVTGGPAVPSSRIATIKPPTPPAPAVPTSANVVKPRLNADDSAAKSEVPGKVAEAGASATPAPVAPETSTRSAATDDPYAQLPAVAPAHSAMEGGGASLVESATGTKASAPTTTLIPVKYADPADIALMLGGTVSYAESLRPGDFQAGSRGREMRREIKSDVMRGGSTSGSDDYWSQGLNLGGGGLNRGSTGRGSGRGGFGNQQGGRGTSRGGFGGQSGQGGGFRPDNVDYIVAYMPQNALLVSGDPAGIDQLREVLALLDQPVKQVEISTKFLQVDVTEDSASGIDWFVSNGSLEFFNLGFAPGEAVNNLVRWSRGKFEATLGIVQQQNKGTVINEPRVIAQNNMPGYISFFTEIPYFSASITYNQFGQREVEFTDDSVSVEQTLEVTPRINADDTITMFLTPRMDDQTGVVVGPNGEQIPITATQEVETQVTVADGETVVLGGMIRKQRRFNTRTTPLLSEIPIIGKLFRSKLDNTQDSELLIFVTPRIIRDIPAP